jgi:hypothetical protein
MLAVFGCVYTPDTSRIQSRKKDTLVYPAGKVRRHPVGPQLVTPTSMGLVGQSQTRGPPLSPCK